MKTQDDLKTMLAQWRTQFPNLYLRAVRGDCSVTVLTKANPLTPADLDYIEETYMPLPTVATDLCQELVVALPEPVAEEFIEAVEEARTHDFLQDFADLAEEAGMSDVAEELAVAAEEVKPKKARKHRKAKLDPSNFPL